MLGGKPYNQKYLITVEKRRVGNEESRSEFRKKKGADFVGHAVAQLVGALRYNPEGRGFDSLWCHWNVSLN
jgi:hypothetical protein